MDVMKNFLEIEISYQEMYDEILYFIDSYDIRCGELECNEYVIRKIDRDNFLVFNEYVRLDGKKEVFDSFSVSKESFKKIIEDYAINIGLVRS